MPILPRARVLIVAFAAAVGGAPRASADGPAAGVELKLEEAFRAEPGRALPPLAIHDPALKADEARCEVRLRALEEIERGLAGALVQEPRDATDQSTAGWLAAEVAAARAALATAGVATQGDAGVKLGTAEARAALFDEYRLAASKADEAATALHDVEARYADLLLPSAETSSAAPLLATMDAGARTALLDSLRARTLAALATRGGAVDDYLRATVAAEGTAGAVGFARAIDFGADTGPSGALHEALDKLERERRAEGRAVEAKEREIEGLLRDREKAAASAAAGNLAWFDTRTTTARKELSDLREEAGKTDAEIAESRRDADKVAADARVGHLSGGALTGAVGEIAAAASSPLLALEIARRRLGRASIEAENDAILLSTLASVRVDLALRARRDLVKDDADFLDECLGRPHAAARAAATAISRDLRGAYLDQAVAVVARKALQGEEALLAQNEYLAAFAKVVSEKQIESRTGGTRGLQFITDLARGGLDLGAGLLEGLGDEVKQIANAGGVYHFKTKSEKTWRTIRKEREKALARVELLEQARGMSDEQVAQFLDVPRRGEVEYAYRAPVPLGDDGDAKKLLEGDRAFFEATDGGLRRIASALDMTLLERLDTEYEIACEHAALVIDDLETMRRRRFGVDEKTGRWTPAILLSPTTIAGAIQFKYGSGAADLEAHMARRKAELDAMRARASQWKALGFDEAALDDDLVSEKSPTLIRDHGRLLASSPDYQRFWQTAAAERQALERDLFSALAKQARGDGDRVQAERLERRADALRATPPALDLLARSLLGKAIDLDYAGDYVGSFQALVQANRLDWHLVPIELVDAVQDELAWKEARDQLVVRLRQVGDQAFFAALSARIFPGPAKPAGNFVEGFVKFAHAQVNPFASLFTTQALLGGEMKYALLGLARGQVDMLAGDALKDGMVTAFGEEYLTYIDSIANAVVHAASWAANKVLASSFYRRTAVELDEIAVKLARIERLGEQAEYAAEEWQRRAAREQLASMTDLVTLQDRARTLRGRLTFLQKLDIAAEKGEEVEKIARKLGAVEAQAERLRSPVTARRVEDVVASLHRGLTSADPDERARFGGELLRRLDWQDVVRLRLKGRLTDAVAQRVDEARRAVVEGACDLFLQRLLTGRALPANADALALPERLRHIDPAHYSPDEIKRLGELASKIVALAYTGSSGRPQGKEYKLLQSDIDITVLLDDSVTNVRDRELLRRLLDDTFRDITARRDGSFGGFDARSFDVVYLVERTGYFTPESPLAAAGPAEFARLARTLSDEQLSVAIRSLDAEMESLAVGVRDPEKYVTSGRLRALAYLTGISGVVHPVDRAARRFSRVAPGDTTSEAARAAQAIRKRAFGGAQLEAWMGFDIMLDDLAFLEQHAKASGPKSLAQDDLYAFTDKLDEYAIRVLLGRLTAEDGARAQLNALLDAPDGGDHGSIVDVAVDLAKRQPGTFSDAEVRLLKEWKNRKHNLKLNEIVAERVNGSPTKVPDAKSPVFQKEVLDHIAETQALVQRMVKEGAKQGAQALKTLDDAARAASAAGKGRLAEVLSRKRDLIVLAYAADYRKLDPRQKAMIAGALKQAGCDIDAFASETEEICAQISRGGAFPKGAGGDALLLGLGGAAGERRLSARAREILEKLPRAAAATTNRDVEKPYHAPDEMHVFGPGEPLDLGKLDPTKLYLWLIDPDGNVRVAAETQDGFFYSDGDHLGEPRPVKHGDLVAPPLSRGGAQSRGPARYAGEFKYDAATGRWVMNDESSYAFLRADGYAGTPADLAAARDLLKEYGTDTSSLDTKHYADR